MRRIAIGLFFAGNAALVGCGWSGSSVDAIGQGDNAAIPPRYVTVVSDGCTPDTWQSSTLAGAEAKRVTHDVILLCAVPRADGFVGPADPSARAQLAQTVTLLKQQGYTVRLGVSFRDETAERYDGAQTARELGDPQWRGKITQDLATLATSFDGVELDLQQLPASARGDLTLFVQGLSPVRASKKIGLFVPPSTRAPSDVPGGDAFDLASLAPYVDRVRVMTLDYAAPGAGPTLDSGWAVQAARYARPLVGSTPMDVAAPLYGNDVSDLGTRMVSYFEARALEDLYGITPDRSTAGAPHFSYTDAQGHGHELWYDDADSTSRALRAWDPATLPLDVGVVLYGLGDEDPALWQTLARGAP